MRRRPVMAWRSVSRGVHPDESGSSIRSALSSESTVRERRPCWTMGKARPPRLSSRWRAGNMKSVMGNVGNPS